MKALILAAALALTPVAASAAPPSDDTAITNEEVMARAGICLELMSDKLTAQQVITGLQLNTVRKQRDFALQCRMLMLGGELGRKAAMKNLA